MLDLYFHELEEGATFRRHGINYVKVDENRATIAGYAGIIPPQFFCPITIIFEAI